MDANSDNVTLRLVKDKPLTYEEHDENFQQLINLIDEYHEYVIVNDDRAEKMRSDFTDRVAYQDAKNDELDIRDRELQDNIDLNEIESKDRDTTLQSNIDTVDQNSQDRDSTIQGNSNRIEQESKGRDTDIQNNVDSNEVDSKNRDNTLQSNIDTVEQDSIARDNTLDTNINSVDQNSRDRDTTLQNNIDVVEQESKDRDTALSNTDIDLQDQITKNKNDSETADNDRFTKSESDNRYEKDGAVLAHEQKENPHPQYVRKSGEDGLEIAENVFKFMGQNVLGSGAFGNNQSISFPFMDGTTIKQITIFFGVADATEAVPSFPDTYSNQPPFIDVSFSIPQGTFTGQSPFVFPVGDDSNGFLEGSEMSVGVKQRTLTGGVFRVSRVAGANNSNNEFPRIVFLAIGVK